MFDLPTLLDAEVTLWRFVDALKAGDESEASAVLYEPSFDTWGVSPGSVVRGFLDASGLSEVDFDTLGIVHTARILPGHHGPAGLVAFGLLHGTSVGMISHPTPARAMALIRDGDHWKVWGTPDPREFTEAILVHLPMPDPVDYQMLSVLSAEWVMAIQPHLVALMLLESPADEDAELVSPIECAHAIAAVAMLVFAIESQAAGLAASGRIGVGGIRAVLASPPDAAWRQELIELIVLRDLVVHNHVWRIHVTIDADWNSESTGDHEHVFGRRGTRSYREAVEDGVLRTKRLGLHVVPTAVRRIDVGKALRVAVATFDFLAGLDEQNVASAADYPLQVGDRSRSLREISTRF